MCSFYHILLHNLHNITEDIILSLFIDVHTDDVIYWINVTYVIICVYTHIHTYSHIYTYILIHIYTYIFYHI